jgi:membrane protein DedA with SNARE-associated domain
VRIRRPLLGLAGLRVVAGIIAIPLAPFLYEEHFVALVLLRPTKEVFLLGGLLVDEGDVNLAVLVLAALPFLLGGVWLFYGLGLGYRKEINSADLPGVAGRLLPPKRIKKLGRAVEDGGPRLVFLGRLASFPSSLVGAAAGTGAMATVLFLIADGLGAVTSMAMAIGAGMLLEEAYENAGPWFTALGVVALGAIVWMLGRRLRSQGGW